jgi:hypothetical protein
MQVINYLLGMSSGEVQDELLDCTTGGSSLGINHCDQHPQCAELVAEECAISHICMYPTAPLLLMGSTPRYRATEEVQGNGYYYYCGTDVLTAEGAAVCM